MEDYKYKLSIIIPMYNCEKYIANCLDSILNSDLPKGEYEVIIVNDGSKDNGPEIAKSYVSKHKDFKYLTQENQGQSVARNNGIEHACGEYIWFVDSDDLVNCKLINIFYILKLSQVDVLCTAMYVKDVEGKSLSNLTLFNIPYNKIIEGREVFFSNVPVGSVCNKFIKRSFINDCSLSFIAGITHQDVEFSYRMFAYAKSVMFVKEVSYVYIKHPNSTSMSIDPKKKRKYILDSIFVIHSVQKLSKDISGVDLVLSERLEENSYDQVLGILINVYKNIWNFDINKYIMNSLIDKELYPLKYKFKSVKKRLIAKFLNSKFVMKY